MERLTESQQRVFEYLKERSQSGFPPSVREICAELSIKSTSTVHQHLRKLEELGYIERGSGLNRAIKIANEAPVVQVPLVGRVTAGIPILAIEEIVAYIPFSGEQRRDTELFALRVVGESMIEAGILDGDIIVCEKTETAQNGEIVVAMIDEEATVKRFYREEDHIRLQPENPLYEPIISRDVSILGKVISCIRYYS
ncbi:MAG: transcriptional repressor LexA [Oscillospiraceae bacterium]|jgi:repressor LexA|nr:transcriptional repressor LexA [Oscillospiraceae bacterium]